ncbi:frizzled-4 isoform X2 [Dendroctonus ponderosae]|uniref:frizzled-4 isoform X2 n=1 Tax=Dendroctonus ponderosae TaxID=77166 RepID=UPI002035C45B|nr:frizzled-4 isoform X2 [Dendroctonus ponderosae]
MKTLIFLSVFCIVALIQNSAAERCETISLEMCQNLGYNSTLMPNRIGHLSQINADLELRIYEPLLQHQCSKYIRLFICSVFVPMCSEHVPGPILACKGLCEKVKENCEETFLTNKGLKWPKALNCSSFPEPPALCMQQPEEIEQIQIHYFNPEDTGLGISCPPNTLPSAGKCVPACKSKQHFDPKEVATFELWVGISSINCLIFTTFGLITFIIQPKRFRWPARPILYLTSCGFVSSTIYLIRCIEGPYTCAGNLAYEKPAESLSCVGIALILLFCDIAYTLWWTVFCLVWFLSAVKEWSTEAIEKVSSRLHAIVWIFSAIPMFYVLMSNHISINHHSGFCEVTNRVLVAFQLFFMMISSVLALLTSVALKDVRKTLINAGRSPVKLERLFYRLLVISVGISVPYLMYLMFQFYHTFKLTLLKLLLRKSSIIFATLKSNNETQSQSNGMFSQVISTILRRGTEAPSGDSILMVQNKTITAEKKNTIVHVFFTRTSPSAPVARV